jgi:Concanavalin A-like lectin/glucanases superfamily
MAVLTLNNTTGSAILSSVLGVSIAANSSFTVSPYDYGALSTDTTVLTAVQSGNITVTWNGSTLGAVAGYNTLLGTMVTSLAVDGGTQRINDINLKSGSGMRITDDGAGNFTFTTDTSGSTTFVSENVEDFLMSTSNPDHSTNSVDSVVGNGGTTSIPDLTTGNNFLGSATANTGGSINSTGYAAISLFGNNDLIVLGGLQYIYECRIRIPTLSGTPSFIVVCGFIDTMTNALPNNGVFFEYTNTLNSGQWVGITRASSTSNPVNSSIAVVANTWYKLRAVINSAGTSVSFYVNGTLIGTSTTYIPTTTLGLACLVYKTSSSSASRSVNWDYAYWSLTR